jgi:hypothetical protein
LGRDEDAFSRLRKPQKAKICLLTYTAKSGATVVIAVQAPKKNSSGAEPVVAF